MTYVTATRTRRVASSVTNNAMPNAMGTANAIAIAELMIVP